ncbi:unnamed protein product [Schistosoma turkestanicum]|nr:unnamed protein product [Schistosoma turkestanicum]
MLTLKLVHVHILLSIIILKFNVQYSTLIQSATSWIIDDHDDGTKLSHQNYAACRRCDTNHVCHEIMFKDLIRVRDLNVITIKLDGTLNSLNEPAFVGCTCEFNPSSRSTIIPTGSEVSGINHLCPVNLPDIGETCDHSNSVCRSLSAQCVSHDLSNKKVCTCPVNTIAVYQIFLNYFECFAVVNESASNLSNIKKFVSDYCQPCQKINGTCYDQNNDGIPDGCRCPPGRSFIYKSDRYENSRNTAGSMNLIQHKDELKFPCQLKHIETKCDERQLTVCYFPHTSGKFQTLPYYLQMNMIHISLVQSMYSELSDHQESCSLSSKLKPISTTSDAEKNYPFKDKSYCITLSNDQLSMNTCTVNLKIDSTCNEITHTQNLQYSGNVYVRQKNKIYLDGKTILKIPWECTAKRICNLTDEPIHRITNQVQNNLRQLFVMNMNNEIITEIGEGELVYLELISNYEKFVISTKMCAVASLKFPESYNSKSVIDMHLCRAFYHFKYYVADESIMNSYHNQTIFISHIPAVIQYSNTSLHRSSEIFPALQIIPQQNTIYYICLVPSVNASMAFNADNSKIQDLCDMSNNRIRLSPADHLFVTKLTIRNSLSSHHIKCTLLSCLDLNQVTFICCFLLLTNLAVCVTVIWVCKRKQQLKQHQLQYTFSQNLHSEKLLNDSLNCSMLPTITPEIVEAHQKSVHCNELEAYLNSKVYDDFKPSNSTNCPKCMGSAIKQTDSLLSYQKIGRMSQVPSNEDLIYLSLLNGHSITTLHNCKQQPISETLTNNLTSENFDV